MTCRLIDFALVVLYLVMFKVGGIIGISKIEVFIFSRTERGHSAVLEKNSSLNNSF